MAGTIRFHLDEHVDPAIAVGLNRRGIDVTTSADAGLLGAGDDVQIAFSTSQGRVLVTHDDGFLRVHHAGIAHAGIAYCHQQHRSIGQIIRSLELM